jgi:hypothetical protein
MPVFLCLSKVGLSKTDESKNAYASLLWNKKMVTLP